MRNASRIRLLSSGLWCAAALAIAALLSATPEAQQSITVTAANPSSAAQGTINLDVTISGSGFKKGALAHFFLTGTTDPGGITVNSTTFNGSSQVTANIDVSSTADIANFDVVVQNTDGRNGKGTELFSVFSNGNASSAQSCSVLAPLPSILTQIDPSTGNPTTATGAAATLVGLNTLQPNGQPTYINDLGLGIQMKAMAIGARTVVLTAVFHGPNISGGSANVEIFFLDPVNGQILDGQALDPNNPAAVQPHLTVPNPYGNRSMAIGDVNGDGIPDLAAGNGVNSPGTAGVLIGQMSNGVLTGFIPVTLTPPTTAYNFLGSALAIGDLDADGLEEVVVGAKGGGTGKGVIGKVFVFKYDNNGGFTAIRTLADPGNKTDDQFGQGVAIGDVSGDSSPDVIVSAPFADIAGVKDAGAAYVYAGPVATWPASPSFYTLTANVSADAIGHSVGTGRISGTLAGRSVIVSTGWSSGENIRAAIFGPPQGAANASTFDLFPVSFNMGQGWTTTEIKAIDLNGDGSDDVLIGAPNATQNSSCNSPGAAYLFLSDPNNPGAQPTRYMLQAPVPDADFAAYGWSMGAVPGSRLVLVGEHGRNLGGVTDAGQVYVYRLVP